MLDGGRSQSFGTIERPEILKDLGAANAPWTDISLGRDVPTRSTFTRQSVNLGELTDAQLKVHYFPSTSRVYSLMLGHSGKV